MKRLAITMGVAAAMFGVRAETTVVDSENFNAKTADAALTVESPWSTEDADGNFMVRQKTEGDNFLTIDSGDMEKPLFFGDKAVAAETTTVMIDAQMKFTAFDEDPNVTPDAKIMLWAKDNAETGTTDLYATVGKPVEHSDPEPTVVLIKTGIDAEAWHHVVIKSVGPVLDAEWEMPILGFILEIDGAAVEISDSTVYENFDFLEAWNESVHQYLTLNEYEEIVGGRLLPSLVKDAMTVTSVGFKGCGSVDDLSIATEGTDPEPKDWPAEKDITASDTPEGKGIDVPTELKKASLAKIVSWAKANNIEFADSATINVEAFLLNVAPTEKAVNDAKAAFKFTSIEPGTEPTISGDYNGKVVVTAGADPAVKTPAEEDAPATFYKAKLVVDEINAD